MKKFLVSLTVITLLLTLGCEKVEEGKYKEGTYYGYVVDNYGGKDNVASAVVYVDNHGLIKSVFIDTTYNTKNGGNTTKKALGDEYGMKAYPNAAGEWDEQMEKLEAKIIEKQEIEFLTLNDEGKTDTVTGVTIKIGAIHKALEKALNQAKK